MKVILTVDVKNLGKKGDIVQVADGMAMNSLLPQKKAIIATNENMQKRSAVVHNKDLHISAKVAAAQKFVDAIPDSVILHKRVTEKGNLFESVDTAAIVKELSKLSGQVWPDVLKLTGPQSIKAVGSYEYVASLQSADGKSIKKTITVVIEKQ